MRVLVLYQLNKKNDRNTIDEHLYSFKRYSPKVSFHYFNILDEIPAYLQRIKYDAVIMHYTFLAGNRFIEDGEAWDKKVEGVKQLIGYKVAIPQDEYDHTNRICKLFREARVDIIYSCFYLPEDIEKAYSPSGVKKVKSVFTGYVDEKAAEYLSKFISPYKSRPIDIGYRARKLPAYFGRHGQLKYELVQLFETSLINKDLVYDISNTNKSYLRESKDLVKLGHQWYDFLLNCKAFVGCEGGSSLLDPDGTIKQRVNNYYLNKPDASFDEVEEACFKGEDYNISCFAISPRHFESVICKTLQILVEGYYGGIFVPWRHYVPLKRDFSNLDEVLNFLKKEDDCQRIIDTAYDEIGKSGKYTYRAFVQSVISDIKENATTDSKAGILYVIIGTLFNIRNRFSWLYYDYEVAKNKFYWWRIRTKNKIGYFVLYTVLRRQKKHLKG